MALSKSHTIKAGSIVADLAATMPSCAARCTITYAKDVVVPATYMRVADLSGSKDGVAFSLEVFEDSYRQCLIERQMHTFVPNMEGANFVRQAYEHLKTLPEFADAVDC